MRMSEQRFIQLCNGHKRNGYGFFRLLREAVDRSKQ